MPGIFIFSPPFYPLLFLKLIKPLYIKSIKFFKFIKPLLYYCPFFFLYPQNYLELNALVLEKAYKTWHNKRIFVNNEDVVVAQNSAYLTLETA